MDQSIDPRRSAYYLALLLGAISGLIDLFVPWNQLAPALIVACTFLLSLAYPRQAWQWALMVGIFVPMAHLVASEFGYVNFNRPANLYLTYLALIPAFIGAYLAVLLRKFGARYADGAPPGGTDQP